MKKIQQSHPDLSIALLLICLWIILLVFPARSAEPSPTLLDLESAQAIALEKNPSFSAARERLNQAAARVSEARSAWWPQLTAQAGVSRIDQSDRRMAGSDASNPEDWYNAELKASWLVFDGLSREFGVAAARHGKMASESAIADARRLLNQGVAHAFFNHQLAREEERIAQADLEFYERLIVEAQARLDAGSGSQSDLLGIRVRANEARALLIETRRLVSTSLVTLAELMAIDLDDLNKMNFSPLPVETDLDVASPSRAALLQSAQQNRPDLHRAHEETAAATAEAHAARGEYFPQVLLTGAYGGERSQDASFRDDDMGSTVGVALSFPLFEGGRIRAKVEQSRSRQRETELATQSLQNAIESEISNALSSLAAAQQQLVLQTENLDVVRQVRELVQLEYQVGQETLVRLNEAQRDLVAAESRHARARTHLRLAWLDMETVSGE